MKNKIIVIVSNEKMETQSSTLSIKSKARSKINYTLPQTNIFDNTFRPKFN